MAGDQNPFEKDNVDNYHRQPFLDQGRFRPNANSNFREISKFHDKKESKHERRQMQKNKIEGRQNWEKERKRQKIGKKDEKKK